MPIFEEQNGSFTARPLTSLDHSAADDSSACSGARGALRILAFQSEQGAEHALLIGCDCQVRVNGLPVLGGICVLQHRDEILVGSRRVFFSAESTPEVEVFQHVGPHRRPRCPVCRGELLDQQPVVHCPGCGRIYHQIPATEAAPAKPCWTYSATCRFCNHPTSLSGEPTWCPDEEL